MSPAQFVQGIRQTFGSRYGMSDNEYTRWIKIYGMPDAPRQDPAAAQMAAMTRAMRWYASLRDWDLVTVAWTKGFAAALKAKRTGNLPSDPITRQTVAAVSTRANAADPRLADPNAPALTGPMFPQNPVVTITIPAAPDFDAQGQLDAYLAAQAQAAEEADRLAAEQSQVATGGVMTQVLQALSTAARGSAGSPVEAPPSQELTPTQPGVNFGGDSDAEVN